MFKNGTKVGTMIRMLKSGRFAKRRPKSPSITWVRARGETRVPQPTEADVTHDKNGGEVGGQK